MTSHNPLTLSDLIETVNELTTSEAERLAVVASLINSGRVRLCGELAGAKIDLAEWDAGVPPRDRDAA